MNLVHWKSLHPKKGHFTYFFFGQTPHLLGEKLKSRTNNLDHRKAGSVAVILSLRVKGGGPTYTKSGAIIFPTRWQSNVHCILQGLLENTVVALTTVARH